MDFPCQIIHVSGSIALATYQTLKSQAGVWPVILGNDQDVNSLSETMTYRQEDYETLLQQASSINPLAWFEKRHAQDPEYYDLTAGDWQDLSPADALSQHLNVLTGEPKEYVAIALVPVSESWQIPAFLKIGGWNDCPTAAEHTAIFKYWHQQYGLRVASVGGDVIELEIDRPPTTREQALQLAQQQFLYCPDIVYQGTQTIAALASTLLNGRVWFFWWD